MSLAVHLVDALGAVAAGDVVSVTGDEARHAVAVRRLRVGEPVALTDGLGHRAVGEVIVADRARLEVAITSMTLVERPTPAITVIQAIPKGDRGELAVEVLTEVGVDRIVPWTAARCVAVWRGERAGKALSRWRATAREAAKQSRRAWHPEVAEPVGLAGAVELVTAAEVALVLHEEGVASLGAALAAVGEADGRLGVGSVVLVVGPEGGLTPDEVVAFEAAGASVVRLGSEVLRTSTAGVAAVAAVLSRTSRW